MTPRADRMTEPLVEGQFYLVPTVKVEWIGRVAAWPVIGTLHEDAEFFNFGWDHYHVDARFLARGRDPYLVFQHPLHAQPIRDAEAKLPKPALSRRKCVRSLVMFTVPWRANPRPLGVFRAALAGRQCDHGKGGWICPHRKASLGSIVPVDGIITCPLHGLQINAATGKVLEVSTP